MQEPQPDASAEPIQFEKVEYGEGRPPFVCASCTRPVTGEYYAAGTKFICPACRDEIESPQGGARRLLIAGALGSVAAAVGGLIWFGVRRVTGYEIGLIAIAVGLIVGVAVRLGAKGRGGLRYQVLAVFLTYTGIALNYAPDVFMGIVHGSEKSDAAPAASTSPPPSSAVEPAAKNAAETQAMGAGSAIGLIVLAVVVIGLSYTAPFLGGFENIIGVLIIGFALFEAWRINRRVPTEGPFRTGEAPPAQTGIG